MVNVFDKDGKELKIPIAFHPGELLLEEIEERELKKTDFAKSIGLLPGNLSDRYIRLDRMIFDSFGIV